jgi:hypothetical protein
MSYEKKIAAMTRAVVRADVKNAEKAVNLRPSAIEDTVERLMQTAAVDDDGRLIYKIGTTILRGGDQGLDPITTLERLQELRTSAPHLFGEAASAGNQGLSQAEIDKLSPEDKIALANELARHKHG